MNARRGRPGSQGNRSFQVPLTSMKNPPRNAAGGFRRSDRLWPKYPKRPGQSTPVETWFCTAPVEAALDFTARAGGGVSAQSIFAECGASASISGRDQLFRRDAWKPLMQ